MNLYMIRDLYYFSRQSFIGRVGAGGGVDAIISIGSSFCFVWSVGVAGTECWFTSLI